MKSSVQTCHFHNAIAKRQDNHERDDAARYASADEMLHTEISLARGVFLHDRGCTMLADMLEPEDQATYSCWGTRL